MRFANLFILRITLSQLIRVSTLRSESFRIIFRLYNSERHMRHTTNEMFAAQRQTDSLSSEISYINAFNVQHSIGKCVQFIVSVWRRISLHFRRPCHSILLPLPSSFRSHISSSKISYLWSWYERDVNLLWIAHGKHRHLPYRPSWNFHYFGQVLIHDCFCRPWIRIFFSLFNSSTTWNINLAGNCSLTIRLHPDSSCFKSLRSLHLTTN